MILEFFIMMFSFIPDAFITPLLAVLLFVFVILVFKVIKLILDVIPFL